MSARDEFIKRVQDNSDAAKNHEVQVRNDIQHYCSAMESLSRQVQEWMDGSGVEVQQAIIFLSDETIRILPGNHISQYNIASIKMKNSDRHAELKPVGVYGGGARGWASLIVTSPRRAPSSEIFQLRLDRDSSEWIIRRENQRTAEGAPLTEDTFFRAISALA